MAKNIKAINGELEDIGDDVDDVLEDTSAIDRKTSILIALWIADKVIMALLIIWLGR